MYLDPARVRSNETKLRFNDYENDELDKLVAESGGQKCVVLREIVMAYVKAEKERKQSNRFAQQA